MKCQIDNKGIGEYQCSKCGKIVCKKHQKKIDGKIVCTQCLGSNKTSKAISSATLTIGILLGGMLTIVWIAEGYIAQLSEYSFLTPFVSILDTVKTFLVLGVGGLFAILIISYLITKKKNL